MQDLLQEFKDVFSTNLPDGLSPSREADHSIEGQKPIRKLAYRLIHSKTQEVENKLNKYLDKGFIWPSSSPWASLILLIKKKDGSMRMCIDYRALN